MTDKAAGAISPQKLYGTPVGLMFFEGAPRLSAAGVTIPGLQAGDPERIVVEAYPGVLARALIGRRGYKQDTKAKQTAEQAQARRDLLSALSGADLRGRLRHRGRGTARPGRRPERGPPRRPAVRYSGGLGLDPAPIRGSGCPSTSIPWRAGSPIRTSGRRDAGSWAQGSVALGLPVAGLESPAQGARSESGLDAVEGGGETARPLAVGRACVRRPRTGRAAPGPAHPGRRSRARSGARAARSQRPAW